MTSTPEAGRSDRADRAREIFEAASELGPSERGAYLETACNGETELRAEVESLLGSLLVFGAAGHNDDGVDLAVLDVQPATVSPAEGTAALVVPTPEAFLSS